MSPYFGTAHPIYWNHKNKEQDGSGGEQHGRTGIGTKEQEHGKQSNDTDDDIGNLFGDKYLKDDER